MCASPIRRAPPWAWPACPAARSWRSTRSSTPGEAGEARQARAALAARFRASPAAALRRRDLALRSGARAARTAGVSQHELRTRILAALDEGALEDTLPPALRRRWQLADFAGAAQFLHRPPPDADVAALAERSHPAWRRMKFDELLAQQLSMRFAYRQRRARRAPALPGNGPFLKAFFPALPFKLTRSQSRVAGEVLRDLAVPHPMQRLLQGDVG